MTAEEEKIMQALEDRIIQLILSYKKVKAENIALKSDLKEKETALGGMQARITALEADYANLKLAKIIEINDDEMKNAKSRLSKLVREVDKCIALLNV